MYTADDSLVCDKEKDVILYNVHSNEKVWRYCIILYSSEKYRLYMDEDYCTPCETTMKNLKICTSYCTGNETVLRRFDNFESN